MSSDFLQVDLSRYFDLFRRLDFGSAYPLLLAFYEDYADGQFALAEFLAALGILFSYIVRRNVVGVPSNSLSGVFITLCKSKPVTETSSGIRSPSALAASFTLWATHAERAKMASGRSARLSIDSTTP